MAGNIVAGNVSGEQWVGLTRPTDPSGVNTTSQGVRQAHEERRHEQERERASSVKIGESEVEVEGTEGGESRMEGDGGKRLRPIGLKLENRLRWVLLSAGRTARSTVSIVYLSLIHI